MTQATQVRGFEGRSATARQRPGLIFVTQVLDPSDPVLGFACDLLPPLAERSERLAVIANEIRQLPAGVDAEFISLGKEEGAGRVRRGAKYERERSSVWRGRASFRGWSRTCVRYTQTWRHQ